jgi:hypothetical protein
MHENKMDQNDDRAPGEPHPPWRDATDSPTVDADAESSEPAPIDKPLVTLVSELRARLFRDQKSRPRRDQ